TKQKRTPLDPDRRPAAAAGYSSSGSFSLLHSAAYPAADLARADQGGKRPERNQRNREGGGKEQHQQRQRRRIPGRDAEAAIRHSLLEGHSSQHDQKQRVDPQDSAAGKEPQPRRERAFPEHLPGAGETPLSADPEHSGQDPGIPRFASG